MQWVRNVEATGEVTLKKGMTPQRFRLRPVPDKEKPELLKAYLDHFKLTVQRFRCLPVQTRRLLSMWPRSTLCSS